MSSFRELSVQLAGHHVGRIIRGGGGAWEGSPDADYTFFYNSGTQEKLAVGILMPVYKGFYPGDGQLHPVFEMNLPEGRLREEIWRRFSKTVEEFDDLTMLGIVGSSVIGRLRFSTTGATSGESGSTLCNLQELITYSGSEDLLEDLLQRYAIHSGIAGEQPKVLVQDIDKSGLSDAAMCKLTGKDATHIIKAWDEKGEYPQLAANEYFCLQAARRSGLQTPTCDLSQNGRFLVVERFDLDQQTGEYLGFEDFCSLRGFSSRGKYKGSYEGIARMLEKILTGEALVAAQHDFFKIIVVCTMVRNGDAHSKNFGILYRNPAIEHRQLAPAFDIVTTKAYPRLRNDTPALTMGGEKIWPNRKMLLDFALNYCNLSQQKTARIMEQVCEAVHETQAELRHYALNHPEFQEVGHGMINNWEEGLASSRV